MSVTTVENVLLDVLVIFTLIFTKDKKVDLKSLSTTNPKPYLHIFLVLLITNMDEEVGFYFHKIREMSMYMRSIYFDPIDVA